MEFLEPGKIEDGLLWEVVVAARYRGQWIFSERGLPGGRREPGESIDDTACRLLIEKTGVGEADFSPCERLCQRQNRVRNAVFCRN